MPVTPIYGIPYPALSDPPNGPSQMQALALEVETELARIDAVDGTQNANISALQSATNVPTFFIRNTAAQSLNNTTFTALLFNTEDNDSDNGHSTVTNTDRYTVPKSGLWQASAGVSFATNVTGIRFIRLTLNGTPIAGSANSSPQLGAGEFSQVITRVVRVQCSAGDILRVEGWQSGGGALNTGTTSEVQPSFTGQWLKT
jgi:hypothetical protein